MVVSRELACLVWRRSWYSCSILPLSSHDQNCNVQSCMAALLHPDRDSVM
jgi:hypothetical protein